MRSKTCFSEFGSECEVRFHRHLDNDVWNDAESWDGKNGWYQLDLEGPERRQRIHVEPKAWRITRAREWLGDAEVYAARLGDYSSVGDTALPRRMRLTAPNDVKVDAGRQDLGLAAAAMPVI